MGDRKTILSKRSLRRRVKRNTDTVLARLARNNSLTTGLEGGSTMTELSPTAHVTVGFDTESECGEDRDWFMASDSDDTSATSGPEDCHDQ